MRDRIDTGKDLAFTFVDHHQIDMLIHPFWQGARRSRIQDGVHSAFVRRLNSIHRCIEIAFELAQEYIACLGFFLEHLFNVG